MADFLRNIIRKNLRPFTLPLVKKLDEIEEYVEQNRILTARLLIRQLQTRTDSPARLSDRGFQVFSQWDEDGIIQFLIGNIPIANRTFVEFGVEDYRESNTRFLLMNDNWRGMVIDANEENVKKIRENKIYWRHDLVARQSFITRENINDIIRSADITGDIGLLSIDIDGNDYWVWESIEVISPRIVICEYNSLFGWKDAVSIPYDSSFDRSRAHTSNLYFGASLAALCHLAERKGYTFVGSSQDGSNAFFVRKDCAGNLKPVTCEHGYVQSRGRQSKDELGRLTFIRGNDRTRLIASCQVIDVIDGTKKTVGEIIL